MGCGLTSGLSRRAAGEHQQVVDELAHAPDLACDHVRLDLRFGPTAPLENLSGGEHRHERVSKLMPDLTDLA